MKLLVFLLLVGVVAADDDTCDACKARVLHFEATLESDYDNTATLICQFSDILPFDADDCETDITDHIAVVGLVIESVDAESICEQLDECETDEDIEHFDSAFEPTLFVLLDLVSDWSAEEITEDCDQCKENYGGLTAFLENYHDVLSSSESAVNAVCHQFEVVGDDSDYLHCDDWVDELCEGFYAAITSGAEEACSFLSQCA